MESEMKSQNCEFCGKENKMRSNVIRFTCESCNGIQDTKIKGVNN